jgi:hypothetical protein
MRRRHLRVVQPYSYGSFMHLASELTGQQARRYVTWTCRDPERMNDDGPDEEGGTKGGEWLESERAVE